MADADLGLVLALDCSASVTLEEFGLMAGGLAAALRDPAVVAGLTTGPAGASLCALLLWSGVGAQDTLLDWTRLASEAEVRGFADAVDALPRITRAGLTAVGDGLQACEDLLGLLPAPVRRRVVDMVGDGSANAGTPPDPIRDRMAAAGITINGLCLLHEEPDLVAWYEAHVIGGPDGFALPCPDYPAFTDAMIRKLVREIA
jgi:hypothetical protein